MSKSSQNDVESLLSHVHLEGKAYKTFRKGSYLSNHSTDRVDEPTEPVSSSPIQEMSTLASVLRMYSAAPSPTQPPPATKLSSQYESPQSWEALDSVLALQEQQHSAPGSPQLRHVPLPAVSLISVCGGAGATSIAAALGRLTAIAGQRALLLDDSCPSLLPLYFGGRSPRSFASTFFPVDSSHHGAIHVVPKEGAESAEESDSWIWKAFDHLASDSDRVFADLHPEALHKNFSNFVKESLCLLILTPDIRSLVALQRYDHLLNGASLLLNHFDPSNSLHGELQNRVAARYGNRLLPITVRHDQQVSDALARGMTIIDYAPGSPVTEDLYQLLDWLKGPPLGNPTPQWGRFAHHE